LARGVGGRFHSYGIVESVTSPSPLSAVRRLASAPLPPRDPVTTGFATGGEPKKPIPPPLSRRRSVISPDDMTENFRVELRGMLVLSYVVEIRAYCAEWSSNSICVPDPATPLELESASARPIPLELISACTRTANGEPVPN